MNIYDFFKRIFFYLKKLGELKNPVGKFFERNITSYSYLFFSQAVVAADKLYLQYASAQLPKPEHHILLKPIIIVTNDLQTTFVSFFISTLPLLFLIAAITTVNYSGLKREAFRMMIGINVVIYVVVLSSWFSS